MLDCQFLAPQPSLGEMCSETQAHPFELGDLIKTDKTGEVEDVERLIDAEVKQV